MDVTLKCWRFEIENSSVSGVAPGPFYIPWPRSSVSRGRRARTVNPVLMMSQEHDTRNRGQCDNNKRNILTQIRSDCCCTHLCFAFNCHSRRYTFVLRVRHPATTTRDHGQCPTRPCIRTMSPKTRVFTSASNKFQTWESFDCNITRTNTRMVTVRTIDRLNAKREIITIFK